MNSKIFLFTSLFFLGIIAFIGIAAASNAGAVPIAPGTVEFKNHKIQNFFKSIQNETILLLDDGSTWILVDSIHTEIQESFIGMSVSLMPTAGKQGSDRFVVHKGSDIDILDVKNLNYSRYGSRQIADIDGNQLTIFMKSNGMIKTYFVSEDSIDILSTWSVGDPVAIDGIWFDELDHKQREIPSCIAFTLYNYKHGKFVFVYLPD